MNRAGWVTSGLLLALAAGACVSEGERTAERPDRIGHAQRIDPPAVEGALAPNLALVAGGVAATWLEPVGDDGAGGHRLMFSRLESDAWSSPAVVVEGDDFFANWADLPAVVEAGNGDLLAHWLAKTAEDTYAYSIFLARSQDGGATWQPLGKLNSDSTDTEHGFVAWVPEGEGAQAFWLDGREMAAGGSMTVRTAFVGASIGPESVLDERTCECCAMDAALAADGPLVVYRDRDLEETRDIVIVRRTTAGWRAPQLVAADNWRIEGCPVNGPAVAARGDEVWVAWFTGAEGALKVQIAVADDGGQSFGPAVEVDGDTPLGRVDLMLSEDGAATVSWMRRSEDDAEILLQRFDTEGAVGPETVVARTSAARASGFPRLLDAGGEIFVSWVEVGPDMPQRIRAARYALVADS